MAIEAPIFPGLLTRDGESADSPMTIADIETRQAQLRSQILPLTEAEVELDEEQAGQFRSLTAEFDNLETERQRLVTEQQEAEALARHRREAGEAMLRFQPVAGNVTTPASAQSFTATEGVNVNTRRDESPWDLEFLARAGASDVDELHARALSAAEHLDMSTDDRREALTRMIESGAGDDAQMTGLVLRTTSPAYKRAFGELLRNGGQVALLSDDERQALTFAEPMAALMRAQSTADSGGGYLIPTDIEPSVTLSADGTDNPVWNLARRVQTTGKTYRVVTAPNAAWSWDAEGSEVSDDSVTFSNVDIPLYSANGFIPVTIEAQRSISGIMADVQTVLGGGWNDLIGAALTTGTGSSQPTGIITALAGGSSEIDTAGSGVFARADLDAVFEALAARHRRRATWMFEERIMGRTRRFDTNGGADLIARLGDGSPDRVLGRPRVENEDMEGAVASGNKIAVLGDFQHYVVAEGIGTLVEVIPHVFGSNGRPIGARGIYAKTRLGADSVLDAAFRLLNVAA